MAKQTTKTEKVTETKIKRKGVHSKKKTSNSKNSKNYAKKYVGQGR